MSEIKVMSNDEIRDFCIKKDLKIFELEQKLQQKENIIKEVREYIEKNWISQKDADNYRFDDEELDIEISDIAVLFDILDKEVIKSEYMEISNN